MTIKNKDENYYKEKSRRQLEATKRWQARNKKHVERYRRKWNLEGGGKRSYWKNREQRLQYSAKLVEDMRRKTIELYGGKCNECGISDIDCLAIDHINNDGHKTKTRAYGYWKRLVEENDKSRYQVLCHNHNWKKYLTNLRSKKYGNKKHKTKKI